MSKGSKKKDDKKEKIPPKELLAHIPGVGPKTSEKLIDEGFGSLEKLGSADPEKLAEAVSGLSVAKSKEVIDEAKKLHEGIESGAIDLTKRRRRRRRAPEPDPDIHELPPAAEVEEVEERVSLSTGLDEDKTKLGIHIGPKWLSKFEKARIIGARALQISMGAPILIDASLAGGEIFVLADQELKEGVLPMTVRRTLPTGEYFDIPLSKLLEHTRLD